MNAVGASLPLERGENSRRGRLWNSIGPRKYELCRLSTNRLGDPAFAPFAPAHKLGYFTGVSPSPSTRASHRPPANAPAPASTESDSTTSSVPPAPTTHIALVRGINVGGHRQVGMTNLRNFLTELGFENVRSVLQSGNLVFGSRSRFGAELERYLEMEAVKRLALESDFYVRTVDEWKGVVRQNPFRKEAELDPKQVVVLFLRNPPPAEDVALLQADISGPEVVKAKGKQAYIFYPDGIGRSKLTNAMIEKRIGRGTGRNWNTVLKLDVIAKAGSLRLTPVAQRKRIV
jgi:uncharacterized protein (DUF1697 family)